MTKPLDNELFDASARLSRPARLHALLFAGAALGTTLLTALGGFDVKLPRYLGE